MEGTQTESAVQNSEAKATSNAFASDDLRPFSEIKNKVEDIIDQVVQKNFQSKPYEAKSI